MYRVCKSFTFNAAHKLIAPYEGKCNRMHGHTWRVDVVVVSEMLDPCGMVVDFNHLSLLNGYLEQRFDHATVNNTVKQPTAENIARHIYEWCRTHWSVERVRVWESDTSWGEYGR
jgi:6-pyruvoyltetrahydropterin/6-carboxytetrahydropterin synthase